MRKPRQRGATLGDVKDSNETTSPNVTVVVTNACHLCEDAVGELTQRVSQGRLDLTVVTADSQEGRALLAQHRPTMFPLALLDGQYFSAGRLPRRKLDKVLTAGGAR